MDLHFLLRNGISGGVLAAMFALGWGLGDAASLEAFLREKNLAAFTAMIGAATPVIGICLHGAYLTFTYLLGRQFTDAARSEVARHLRTVIVEHVKAPDRVFGTGIGTFASDPFFVLLYHTHAPLHLIEWARRRRSYHYLGITASTGAVIGFVLGALASGQDLAFLLSRPAGYVTALILVAVVIACWLSWRMLQDVNQMEALWALVHLNPALGRAIKLSIYKDAVDHEARPTTGPAAGRSGEAGP
jgi:hypothetical protein